MNSLTRINILQDKLATSTHDYDVRSYRNDFTKRLSLLVVAIDCKTTWLIGVLTVLTSQPKVSVKWCPPNLDLSHSRRHDDRNVRLHTHSFNTRHIHCSRVGESYEHVSQSTNPDHHAIQYNRFQSDKPTSSQQDKTCRQQTTNPN